MELPILLLLLFCTQCYSYAKVPQLLWANRPDGGATATVKSVDPIEH